MIIVLMINFITIKRKAKKIPITAKCGKSDLFVLYYFAFDKHLDFGKIAIRCVNCSLRLDRIRRHRLSDESEKSLKKIRRRVYLLELTGEEYICHACWLLINQHSEQQTPAAMGHSRICIKCGRSILRVRSCTILQSEMSEKDRLVGLTIAEWIQREIKPFDKVCIPCWLRAQRATNSLQQQSPAAVMQAASSDIPPTEISDEKLPVFPESPTQEEQEQIETPQIESEPKIILPTIRRAAATARRCLFPECNRERFHIPFSTRRRVLAKFNFYIPTNARICAYHRGSNLFRDLYAADNSMITFTCQSRRRYGVPSP